MTVSKSEDKKSVVEELSDVGAHFGFSKSRRHPSVNSFLFGSKNRNDIFDLEKTEKSLDEAISFVASLAQNNLPLMFVGGKNEAKSIIESEAREIDLPYVAGRWIGGTLTNWTEIKKRVDTMLDLMDQKHKGELSKYTKKERLLIDRDIEKLQKNFGGIAKMTNLPKALFIVDPRFEMTALREAKTMGIPVVALCGSDNDISGVDYPILANDTNRKSIKYFVTKIKETYDKHRTNKRT